MTKPVSFEIDGVGEVEMVGTGPWVMSGNDIRDSRGAVANPTVVQRWSTVTKPNTSVVFAKRATTKAIVEEANRLLAEAESGPAAGGDETQVDG